MADGRSILGFSPRAPWQQLISARLPPYIEMGYIVRRMGTFGRYSSTLAGGVREQRLELFFCIGSIGACAENRIFFRKSKMADGRFEVFRRALLGRGLSAHVAPLRSRPGMASVIWECLVSLRRCSREDLGTTVLLNPSLLGRA